jgi:two-component system sensor histidine kinase DegS
MTSDRPEPADTAGGSALSSLLRERSFWILAAMMVGLTGLHYLTPQIRLLPFLTDPLGRHAVERIAFLLPVAGATFAFGRAGGVTALVLSLVAMIPRALLVSPYPVDATSEVVAVAIVGYLVVWMIETQEREKRLRQEAVRRLRAVNAVTGILTKPVDLHEMLDVVLQRTIDVVGASSGSIRLVAADSSDLVLAAGSRSTAPGPGSPDPLAWFHGAIEEVALSGQPVLRDLGTGAGEGPAADAPGSSGWAVAVPLRSRDEVLGVLALAGTDGGLEPQDIELTTAIGGEIGVALENARLYESMRFYVGQVTRAQEEERKRIARELHDETTQDLIALSRRLEALSDEQQGLPREARERLGELQQVVDSALRGVRRFSQNLRPSVLDDLGLLAALEGMAAAQAEEGGASTDLQIEGEKRRLPPEVELTLFRIAQEALSNVRRHARADRATVTVRFDASEVELIIEDNGRGFALPPRLEEFGSQRKLGIVGMVERVRLLGGTLAVDSAPGRGTRVAARVPT